MSAELRNPAVPAGPVRWPGGVAAAACLSFDVDAESAILAGDTRTADRMTVMSHQAYGPLVAVPRILALLERHDVRSTFFVPGYTAHRYPDVVRAIAGAGHEIAHHGYLHESPLGLDAGAEAAVLDRGLAALEEVAGVRPAGYRAPMWELNYRTPALLAERGFLYDSSLMDADHPYELAVSETWSESGAGGGLGAGGRLGAGGGSLVEVPVSWALGDWEQYAFLPGITGSGVIESPSKALEMWTLELEAFHRIGGVFNLTCHPFLSGRPSRADALERLVERMKELPGLWVATIGEVAAHVRSLRLTPRACPRPALPS